MANAQKCRTVLMTACLITGMMTLLGTVNAQGMIASDFPDIDGPEKKEYCPNGWLATCKETCVKFFEGHETFNSARASCRAMGAELITLETETKAIFFRGLLLYVGKPNHETWIGGHEELGYWSWDGLYKGKTTDVGGSLWHRGQPDNTWGNEHCMDTIWGGRINDANCASRHPYVCEKSM